MSASQHVECNFFKPSLVQQRAMCNTCLHSVTIDDCQSVAQFGTLCTFPPWMRQSRVFQKNTFFEKQIGGTHHASALRLVWKNPKGFLISTKFRGSSSHFCFDHFYIIDFHSDLAFRDRDLQSEGWVKIYNVKMVKTEMARGPPKLCWNQKSFWILSM